jgi:hypothetical protein
MTWSRSLICALELPILHRVPLVHSMDQMYSSSLYSVMIQIHNKRIMFTITFYAYLIPLGSIKGKCNDLFYIPIGPEQVMQR